MKALLVLLGVLLCLITLMACWIHQRTEVMIGKPPVAHVAPRPATSQTECNRGDWSSDEHYLYVCVGRNQWRRVALEGTEF